MNSVAPKQATIPKQVKIVPEPIEEKPLDKSTEADYDR
jgi:hypothetical protein